MVLQICFLLLDPAILKKKNNKLLPLEGVENGKQEKVENVRNVEEELKDGIKIYVNDKGATRFVFFLCGLILFDLF